MFYNYVEKCPNCNSPKTGYYINNNINTATIIKEAADKGELVRVSPGFKKENNCFCAECNHEWNAKIQIKRYGAADIEREKQIREVEEDDKKKSSLLKILRIWFGV